MPAPSDLVHQTSASTGTGNLTLAAVNGKRSFATAFSTGATPDVFDYFISNRNAAEWERGTGHMSDASTLVRDTVIASSNSNSAVSFTAGTLDVTNDVPAAQQLRTADIGSTVQAYDADLTALASAFSAASASGPASLAFAEDTDNGTNKVTLVAPAALGADVTVTLPGADGLLKQAGIETIWIPAGAMKARTTNGAASGSTEMSTNKNMFVTLDFDATTQEFAQFEVFFPKSWNLGTVTFQPVWSHASTTTNFGVVWGLAGVARSDSDAGDVAFGTAQTSADTGGTTDDIFLGPESSAITIAGTPATGDTVQFQLNRTVSDGGDTMAIDARLHGIRLFYTTNAANDT